MADAGIKRWGWYALLLAPMAAALALPGVGVLLSALIVATALVASLGVRAATLALCWRSWGHSVVLGLLLGAAVGVLVDGLLEPLVAAWLGPIDLRSLDGMRGNLRAYLTMMALGLGFGGVVEEVVFRGFFIGWGSALLGRRWSVALACVSAAVFGIAHLCQGWTGVVCTGATGLLLGLAYIAAGRKLLPVVLAHMAINAWGITAIYLGHG